MEDEKMQIIRILSKQKWKILCRSLASPLSLYNPQIKSHILNILVSIRLDIFLFLRDTYLFVLEKMYHYDVKFLLIDFESIRIKIIEHRVDLTV